MAVRNNPVITNGGFGRIERRSSIGGRETVSKLIFREQPSEELAFLARLQPHPNIVKLFLAESTPGLIVLEACKSSLETILRARQPFDLRDMCVSLLGALVFMHSLHIAHGDITPGNVLLASNGSWKICDFGNAVTMRPYDHLCVPKHGFTDSYTAPEVVFAVEEHGSFLISGTKADMWSFALTVLHAAVCDNIIRFELCSQLNARVILNDEVVCFYLNNSFAAMHLPCVQTACLSLLKALPVFAHLLPDMLNFTPLRRYEASYLLTLLLN